jgi:hypothetical protein
MHDPLQGGGGENTLGDCGESQCDACCPVHRGEFVTMNDIRGDILV